MKYFHIGDFNFADKKVIIRLDYNVPLDRRGNISDLRRIKETLPTLRYIIKQNPKQIIIITHLGRPDGKKVKKLSSKKIASALSKLIKQKVDFAPSISKIPDKKIVMLENIRFWKEEESNSKQFANKIARLGNIFVNDAFSASHRQHSSIVGIPNYLPSCSGFLMDNEIKVIESVLKNPKKPFIAIIGGAKMNKINLINNLLKKVDKMLIGGKLAFAFLSAEGKKIPVKIGNEEIKAAKKILSKKINQAKLIIAEDNVDGKDIGEKSIIKFKSYIAKAKTIIWNGSLGMAEDTKYRKGTKEIAKYLANSKAYTLAGGGDTSSILEKLNLAKKMKHVSTGGGASLVLFEGGKLEGIKALEKNYRRFSKKLS